MKDHNSPYFVVFRRDIILYRKMELGRYINLVDWSIIDLAKTCEEKNEVFTTGISSGLDLLMPEKKIKILHKTPHGSLTKISHKISYIKCRSHTWNADFIYEMEIFIYEIEIFIHSYIFIHHRNFQIFIHSYIEISYMKLKLNMWNGNFTYEISIYENKLHMKS